MENKRVKPSKLRQLEVLELRGGLSTDDKRILWVQRMGDEGEGLFSEFIHRFQHHKWQALTHIWLNWQGRCECDYILITRSGIYFFELKHYNGSLVYEQHQQFINQKKDYL